MSDPARDYVHSQFSGPLPRVPFDAPDAGFLRCYECGTTVPFREAIPYEQQAACPQENCLGQLFCIRWPRWRNA